MINHRVLFFLGTLNNRGKHSSGGREGSGFEHSGKNASSLTQQVCRVQFLVA